MLSFRVGAARFDLRAAAVALNGDAVLLHRLAGYTFWSLPGGRVEMGERAEDAIVREWREELGEPVICGDLLWVVENFFYAAGTQFHEIGLYFRANLSQTSRALTSNGTIRGIEGGNSLEFAWFDRKQLGSVDVRPSFLAAALAESPLRLRHVVQRE